MASATSFVRSVISLIEDKKERNLLKGELDRLAEAEEHIATVTEKLELEQEDLADAHKAIKSVDDAEAMYTEAANILADAEGEVNIMVTEAKIRVEEQYAEYDDWYKNIHDMERDIADREAAYSTGVQETNKQLHNRETAIAQREKAVDLKKAAAEELHKEYTDKLAVLKTNIAGLN